MGESETRLEGEDGSARHVLSDGRRTLLRVLPGLLVHDPLNGLRVILIKSLDELCAPLVELDGRRTGVADEEGRANDDRDDVDNVPRVKVSDRK